MDVATQVPGCGSPVVKVSDHGRRSSSQKLGLLNFSGSLLENPLIDGLKLTEGQEEPVSPESRAGQASGRILIRTSPGLTMMYQARGIR
ncbi:hypothetical protein TNCV_4061851 [Trichonephila clavipes]|nr:hypothetical protein TNCV_4061851 [Trichonephila clavipes]